jgi:membrane-bound metal-dependent hydrolase YbcI (DUF457 family)
MLFRTHLVIPIFFILLFFQPEQITIIFFAVAVFASLIPDIDSPFSKIGKHFKIFNFFVKHRGVIHSFSFLFLIGILLFFFAREILFPFVFGYSFHLILDGITIQGIRPLYPMKFRINGIVKTGKLAENIIFLFFLAGDLFLVFKLF